MVVSPIQEASSPEDHEESDEEASPSHANGANAAAHEPSPEHSDESEEEVDDEEAEVEAAATKSKSASPAPSASKLSAIPAHLQTPASKKGAVPFSSPAIESIKTVETPMPEKKERKERKKREKREKKGEWRDSRWYPLFLITSFLILMTWVFILPSSLVSVCPHPATMFRLFEKVRLLTSNSSGYLYYWTGFSFLTLVYYLFLFALWFDSCCVSVSTRSGI